MNEGSESPRLEAAVDWVGAVSGRLIRVWRALPSERRLAAFAAVGLFMTLFLPWYQETVIARGVTNLRSLSASMTGWGAFSFVEAAVLLISAGVLALLFVRAEGQAFHVPGGDGGVITAAGGWTCVLIIWRMFDKQGTAGHGLYTTTSGIEWGIFVALGVGALLTYAGSRIRQAHEPEPPLPGERKGGGTRRGLGRRGGMAESAPRAPAGAADSGDAVGAPGPRDASSSRFDFDDTWIQVEPGSASPGRRPMPSRRASPEFPADTASTDPTGSPVSAAGTAPTASPPSSADTAPTASPPPSADTAPIASPVPRADSEPTTAASRSSAGAERRRPKSIAEPAADRADGPARPPRPARASQVLDRREIAELDIAEPPTPRLRRSAPAPAPRPELGPEDQLTLRLDRPD